jgi:hypothetical protein
MIIIAVIAAVSLTLWAQAKATPKPKATPTPSATPSATPMASPMPSPTPTPSPTPAAKTPKPDAKYSQFGLGVLVGEPMCLSTKVYINDWNAVDAGIGWSVLEEGLSVHADYVFHLRNALYLYKREIPPTIGAGALLTVPRETGPGAPPSRIRLRLPVGLVLRMRTVAMELGGEFVPMWEVHPASGFSYSGGLGVRFFF